MKHTIAGLMVASALIALPLAASAQTSDVQSQINALLEQIKVLQLKLTELLKQVGSTVAVPKAPDAVMQSYPHRVCALLNRNLTQGIEGDDVSGLQEFLQEKGFFSAKPTGYFGTLTGGAVSRWQSSEGITSVGVFGPLSRERMKMWCGNAAEWKLRASPQRGEAPLAVTFGAHVTLTNNSMIADAGDYKIVFGDGSEHVFTCSNTTNGTCPGPHTVQHTYAVNGSYTAQLVHYGYFGMVGPDGSPPQEILGKVQIQVGPIACTKEYVPVCGAKQVVCITTPCNPVPTTYGNTCTMKADGATFLYAGECRNTTTNPADDQRCKAWFDGCNTCSRMSPTSPAMCTLKACIGDYMTKSAYCTAYFEDAVNKPPVISGFSGPTTLSVNQTGSWTVNASDPENKSLSYNVTWGDENRYAVPMMGAAMDSSFVQTTTFTHSYASAGTYTVIVVVKDSAGLSAKTSTTVKVGSDTVVCTMEYAPVCGQPPEPECRRIPPYCAIATPGPTTYSNKCMMNAAKATLIHEGACDTGVVCTADAMLCPNGTYVGRTGPNCQFVCPQ